MTVFEPVPEPAGPLWTRDEDGTVEPWDYDAENGHWVSRLTGVQRPWSNGPANLLELRPSTLHPDLPEGVTALEWDRDSPGSDRWYTFVESTEARDFVNRAVRREVERIEHGKPVPGVDWRAAYEETVGPAARLKHVEAERDRLADAVRQLVDAGSAVVKAYRDSPVTAVLMLGFLREPVEVLRAVIERETPT